MPYASLIQNTSSSSGNFVELLRFLSHAGDTNLKPLESAKLQQKQNKYYSILTNETADCDMKEQVALIVRFVDKNNIIREELVSFLVCKNGVGATAAKDKEL